MRLGPWQIESVVAAGYAQDGGALHGVIARPVWERENPPDAQNRVRLAARCLVAIDRAAGRVVLVDPGPGDRWTAEEAAALALDRSVPGLDAALARLGVAPDDVTDVVLTHLHALHAGGVARRDADGHAALAFPRATHHLQRRHWQWAHRPSERDAPAFRAADVELLGRAERLHLVDGEAELFPGASLVVSEGHTPALQLPRFEGDGTHLVCGGDLVPTRAHLEPAWITAHDLLPVTSLEEKKVLLAEALEDDGIIAFAHDPRMAACRLREITGRPVFREAVEL